MTKALLPPAEWYATLHGFPASAGAVLTDALGAVLLVKQNYRPWWNIPGGILAADEAPHVCCQREVREELGLDVVVGRLLVVDWVAPRNESRGWIGFVFDGGMVDNPDQIVLQVEELDEFAFVAPEQVRERLTANTADRVEAALSMRATGGVAYLPAPKP